MAKAKTTRKTGSRKSGKTSKKVAVRQMSTVGFPKKAGRNTGKIILATLTIGAAGVLGYFGWQIIKKKRSSKSTNLDEELLKLHSTMPADNATHTAHTDTTTRIPVDTTTKKGGVKSMASDQFPLRKGSKGETVRQLQQALINKYGSSILPKYGADGDFGSETFNALKKKGLATTVDESTFNVLTQGADSAGSSSGDLSQKLWSAAFTHNFSGVLSLLKSIKNKDQYQQVSNSFMQRRLNGVRQTLVNGLLSSFHTDEQKQQIRMEFLRMGLQYDGNKWSLSGFEGRTIVTTEPTTIWITATQSLQVPASMVLGNEVTQRLDYTLFENNNKYFLIKTQFIKYL